MGRKHGEKVGRRARQHAEKQGQQNWWYWGSWGALAVALLVMAIYAVSGIVREERFNELDRFIRDLETAFIALGEELAPQLAAVEDEYAREQLQLPFTLVAINQDNPWKNNQRLLYETADDADGTLEQTNMNFFRYEWLDVLSQSATTEGLVAAYVAPLRCMGLEREFDPRNRLDLLIFYHELMHAAQDTEERAGLSTRMMYERYLHFYTSLASDGRPRVIINYETTAYAREIEIMAMMLEGRVREAVAAGTRNPETVAAALNARADQLGTVAMLCELAALYFAEEATRTALPEAFVRKVAEMHEARGDALYATRTSILEAVPVDLENI